MRLHLACGTVYLKGWVNVDMHQPAVSFLAVERPDLCEVNGTTPEHYYKNVVLKNDFMTGKFHKKEVVCDMYADIRNLPFEHGTVDDILAVQVFEHFTFDEGRKALMHWIDLLKSGGEIQIDVPDIDGVCGGYAKARTDDEKEWFIRQIYGSQKNGYNIHQSGYTRTKLKKLFEELGLVSIEILPNIHTYPSFAIKGFKK